MAGTASTLTPEQFNNFGELLRFLRERAELSQRELALQVGYHYSYMSRIEKNERQPDSATLMARFVPALGLDNQPQWTERLLKLAASGHQTDHAPRHDGQAHAAHPPVVASTMPSFDLPLNPLPSSLTPLLGRETEVEALTQLISRSDVRLVTLVGAPGVGKTRMALHTANAIIGTFAHGSAFVDLSPITEPKDVLNTLAGAVGVQGGSSDTPLMIQLINALKHKNILLLIDNFEHVIDASPQLVQLLGNAPQLKALVTSRETLRVSGEYEFAVNPLPVPQLTSSQGEPLIDYAAIQLFAQRAQAVDPGFRLTPEALKAILEICRKLDGLPLAIELAAARSKFITPQAMLTQFDHRLDWVAHGTRDTSAARQTLRGAVEWSYNTLSETECVLMRRLSVFSGGWNASDAEAVCGEAEAQPSPLLRRGEVLDTLIQLTDKSLVIAEKQDHETRFRFLETIHEFVREKLEASGEGTELRNRHLAYFANYAETIENNVDGTEQLKWTRLADQEHNNMRAALDWGLREGAVFQNGLRIAAALGVFWLARGYFREGFERLSAYLQRATEPEHESARIKLLYRSGAMAGYMFDHSTGQQLCTQSVELARALNRKRDLANALFYLSEIVHFLGQAQAARTLLDECITLCRQENYTTQLSLSLTNLGVFLNKAGDFESAQSMIEEGLAIANRAHDIWGTGHALLSLGSINRLNQNYEAAIDYFERSLEVILQIGDRHAEGVTYSNLALLYFIKANYAKVGDCAERSFAVFQTMGNEYRSPYPLRMMGYSAIHAGNVVRARVLMQESLKGNDAIGDALGELACLIGFAQCAIADKDFESAVQLCALAETQREKNSFAFLEPDAITCELVLKQAKKKLGKAAYESAYKDGQALKLDDEIMQLMAE